ncbi:signal peptidase I [Thermodesulfobacteriota bacterium]
MNTDKPLEKEEQNKKKSSLRENIEAIVIAVILALFIRTFIVQAFKIPSGSMKPTLLIGDHILVNKFIYGIKIPFWRKTIVPIKDPKRGDIVVFKFPEDPSKDFIKRVIGIAGDVVEIRDKKVYINHKPFDDKYGFYQESPTRVTGLSAQDNFGPVTVPKDMFFVMGDNRDHSYDSRFWGFVELDALKGKAFIVYWSWNKEISGINLKRVRWNRFGHLLK